MIEKKPMLECRSLSFFYPEGTQALDNVNLAVAPGEFTALLASNGSGKTTLIKILAGLLKPQSGNVLIDGVDINQIPNRRRYSTIGLLLQNPKDQLFCATVTEDIAFGPRNLGLMEDEIEKRIEETLKLVGCVHLRNRAIHHLSFGEQKRIALAGVLVMEPSILLLDEATAGLDPAGEAQMIHFLNQLNHEKGTTVIFATHSVDMLPLFADRICVLERGRVLRYEDTPDIFSDSDMLESAGLRLPYITGLFHDLKRFDSIDMDKLPLTVGEARRRLLLMLAKGQEPRNVSPVDEIFT